MQDLLDSDLDRVADIADGPFQAGAPQLTQMQQQQQWQQLPQQRVRSAWPTSDPEDSITNDHGFHEWLFDCMAVSLTSV